MTVAVAKYDRVHKARETAPLLEGDDLARMKSAVSKLEKANRELLDELACSQDAKARARAEMQSDYTKDLVRVYRELEAGRITHAMLELERVLDRLDNAWSSIT